MRILHVIGTLDPAAGGPSEVVRLLIQYGPEDLEAEVVTLDDPNAPFLRGLPFPVHALGPVGSTFGYTPRLRPWLEMNRNRFDGVVVHGLWQYITYSVWKAMCGR